MEISYIHFYVENSTRERNYFIEKMGFQPVENSTHYFQNSEILVNNGIIFVLSSPNSSSDSVGKYLKKHSSGVKDIAIRVKSIDSFLQSAVKNGAEVLQPLQSIQINGQFLRQARIKGWGDLYHTLIESNTKHFWSFPAAKMPEFSIIDHVVLNVCKGELEPAVCFYKKILGLRSQQNFTIQTSRSGLLSQALVDKTGQFQFNINQPSSDNSQIQEFINHNRGAGIQHIALKTNNLIKTVTQLRHNGLPFLDVPTDYYRHLQERYRKHNFSGLSHQEWQAIEKQGILIDFHLDLPESLLMQIFTHPIFAEPTFFLELIERRQQMQGFGEGNFQALFEAMEAAQMQRNQDFALG